MNNLNMRRVLKQPTLRMMGGGDLQIPQGPGMDRAGFLERNPNIAAKYAAEAAAAPTATPTPQPSQNTAIPTGPDAMAAAKAISERNIKGMEAESDLLKYKVDAAQRASGVSTSAPAPAQPALSSTAPKPNPRQAFVGSGIFGQQQAVTGIPRPPGLREGGEIHAVNGVAPSPWSFQGITNSIKATMTKTPAQLAREKEMADYRAQREAEKAAAAKPTPTPDLAATPDHAATPASRPIAAPRGNQTVLDRRMVGLREGGSVSIDRGHGGRVPGKGHGDKIPAKYEPGEFVVSNDMLNAQPELRGHLRSLRESVLAEKGMTPEQADAKALGGKELRALESFEGVGGKPYTFLDANEAAFQNPSTASAQTTEQKLASQAARKGILSAEEAAAQAQNAARFKPPIAQTMREMPKATSAFQRVGQTIADKASSFAQAVDSHIAKSPTLRMAGELAAEYPKTANVLGKVAKVGGTVANAMYSGEVGAGSTLSEAHVEAMKKPWDPNMAPIVRPGEDRGRAAQPQQPTQRYSSAADSQAAETNPYVAAPVQHEAPKTVQGANGRTYLDEAVTSADHTRSDQLINSAFANRPRDGSDPERNMNALRNNAASMDLYNQGLAARGAGIQVSKDANGQLRLSNSTAPEKMQYTTPDGTPTSDYTKTNQYAEGMQVREGLLASGAAADQRMQAKEAVELAARDRYREQFIAEAQDARDRAAIPGIGMFGHNKAQRAYENKVQLRQQAAHNAAQVGVQRDQLGLQREQLDATRQHNKDQAAALREGHQLEYEGRMAPVRAAEAQRKRLAEIIEAAKGKGGGKPMDPMKLALQIGDKDLVKVFQDIRAGELANSGAEQTQTDKAVGNMKDATTAYTDGKKDDAKSAGALKVMQKLFPGYTTSDTTTQQDHAPEIDALTKIYGRTFERKQMGMDKVNPLKPRAPQLDSMPDFHKAKQFMKAGPTTGLTNAGISVGDYFIQKADGTYVPLGADLGENEINAIRHNMKTGQWRGYSKS